MGLLKKFLMTLGLVIAGLLAYLLLWPVPIEPVSWQSPKAPAFEGPYATNDRLADAQRVPLRAHGPEDVAVDDQGRLYAGFEDGSIRRIDPETGRETHLAYTQGRPLGLAWDRAGRLIIADAIQGLIALDRGGRIRPLAESYKDLAFGFVDDVDVAEDGSIYFSDASDRFGYGEHLPDILEHGGHGRLFRYDPASGDVTLLLDGLQFANGVAVGPEDRYVLVVETGAYRVIRYWLKGERAGQSETVIDNLPGMPDGISRGSGDVFWIALYAPRDASLDFMADKPLLRKVALRLPAFVQPGPAHHAMVLGISADGELLHNLQDASPAAYAPITSVEEVAGKLYLGSLERAEIAILPTP